MSVRFSYKCNVDVATKATSNQKYWNHGSISFKSSRNKANIIPLPGAKDASDYDLVHANFKMKLKAGCCSKSSRIRFDLDNLESGVPDSDWWKVRSPQSDWPRNRHHRQQHQRRATGNSWRGVGRKQIKSDLDCERKCWPIRRDTRTEGVIDPYDEARSNRAYQHYTRRSGRWWDQPKIIG